MLTGSTQRTHEVRHQNLPVISRRAQPGCHNDRHPEVPPSRVSDWFAHIHPCSQMERLGDWATPIVPEQTLLNRHRTVHGRTAPLKVAMTPSARVVDHCSAVSG